MPNGLVFIPSREKAILAATKVELVIKQLLFLDKLATTLVKSAQPCKVSKLDF